MQDKGLKKMGAYLCKPVDNGQLVLFRMVFGFLLLFESLRFIFNGRVKFAFVTPHYLFTFIGFEFLQHLRGYGMYFCFWAMALLALLVMIGLFYRVAIIGFTVLWEVTCLMDKPGYNNHYYLIFLVSLLLCFMPANRHLSIDVLRRPALKNHTCPAWIRWLFVCQVGIVYFFAAICKVYPDWLSGRYIALIFTPKSHLPVVGWLYGLHWVQLLVTYGGLLFDLLVTPLLLYKPTRKYAFVLSVFFNLFNAFTFHIGIFPFLALGLNIFFFEPEEIKVFLFKNKKIIDNQSIKINYRNNQFIYFALVGYLLIQVALPCRSLFFEGDSYWTEEGGRLSWRMMLKAKKGNITYTTTDTTSGKTWTIDPSAELNVRQIATMAIQPDMIWQYAQHLKKRYNDSGYHDVRIFAISTVDLNGRPYQTFIDPSVDLGNVQWSIFKHSDWIVPFNGYK